MNKAILFRNFFCFISVTCFYTALPFKSLNEMQQHAAQYPEQPTYDNEDLFNPDYTSFHKKTLPTVFNRMKRALGFAPKQYWTIEAFNALLDDVMIDRKKIMPSTMTVEKIACAEESVFFIWGDLHGSFHSLVRGLTYLAEHGVIDKNTLKILKPNNYLVFNGDLIDRTAYVLETLTAALALMKANPTTVVYVQGEHEYKNHWENFGLKRELMIRAKRLEPTAKIPLGQKVSEFFTMLPLALYLYTPDNVLDVIRISHRSRDNHDIDEAEMNSFFETPPNPVPNTITYYDLLKKEIAKKNVRIESIISTEEWRIDIRSMKTGLGLLNQDLGATAWAILSSPIIAHQKFFNFYFDAFAELTVHSPIGASTISLYNRDMRSQDPFKLVATYNIVSRSTKEPERASEDAVTLGSSMSLVQGVPTMGQTTRRGLLLRASRENNAGGIAKGKRIRVIVYNDNYTPDITRKNIERLKETDHTDIIVLPVGTPTISSVLPQIEKNEISIFFPITGSQSLRDPKYKGIIHYRGSYNDEVKALIDHILNETSARKFLFFYQDDSYGQGPLAAAHEELKKRGITDWVDVPYQRNSVDLKPQAQKIKQSQPDAIGLFSTSIATRELIRAIGLEHLTNTQLFGISFLGEETFRQYLKDEGLNVLLGAVVPNPQTSNLEIVKEYRKEMDQYGYPYDVFSLEAYIATSILIDAMQKVKEPITRQKIMEQLEALKNYSFKGLTLSFDPQTRSLSNTIWLETGPKAEWIKKEVSRNGTQPEAKLEMKEEKKPEVKKTETMEPKPEPKKETPAQAA